MGEQWHHRSIGIHVMLCNIRPIIHFLLLGLKWRHYPILSGHLFGCRQLCSFLHWGLKYFTTEYKKYLITLFVIWLLICLLSCALLRAKVMSIWLISCCRRTCGRWLFMRSKIKMILFCSLTFLSFIYLNFLSLKCFDINCNNRFIEFEFYFI